MTLPKRFSYGFIVLVIILTATLNIATPFITLLFSYFALIRLRRASNKPVAVILFLVMVTAIFYGFVFFLNQAITALPHIVSTSIPSMIRFAEGHGFELPFSDLETLKTLLLDGVKARLGQLGNFAKIATKEFIFLAIGMVVGVSVFLNPRVDLGRAAYAIPNNLYSVTADHIAERFRNFFGSFATVMGAQLVISIINTALTAIFVMSVNLPYSSLVIVVTFICGLLPILGNLISNSIIIGIGFTVSPRLAIAALVFLVVLHKLEYFLNSKIIGDRIKNPMWLTLLSLIIAERLMGIDGMILAPVILNYIKVEASQIQAREPLMVAPEPEAPKKLTAPSTIPPPETAKVRT